MSEKRTGHSAKKVARSAPKRVARQRHNNDDFPEFSAADLKAMKRVAPVKQLRWKLGLSQKAFATRYGIPLGTLRDWEQGGSPSPTGASYLKVIAGDPTVDKHVRKVRELA
ncbi:MAG: helix-turn-helix domain-containing protein [Deltaproteobacteria bacterium]